MTAIDSSSSTKYNTLIRPLKNEVAHVNKPFQDQEPNVE